MLTSLFTNQIKLFQSVPYPNETTLSDIHMPQNLLVGIYLYSYIHSTPIDILHPLQLIVIIFHTVDSTVVVFKRSCTTFVTTIFLLRPHHPNVQLISFHSSPPQVELAIPRFTKPNFLYIFTFDFRQVRKTSLLHFSRSLRKY